jgi:hypothetical protein
MLLKLRSEVTKGAEPHSDLNISTAWIYSSSNYDANKRSAYKESPIHFLVEEEAPLLPTYLGQ